MWEPEGSWEGQVELVVPVRERFGGRHCYVCTCGLSAGRHSVGNMSAQALRAMPRKELLTDLATGEVANDVGWNLNTPLPFSVKTLPWLPALSSDIGLYCEETLVSVGLNGFADDGGGKAGAEP